MELHAVKTFYTAREGLVELEDDVLSIVRQVKELTGGQVSTHLDPDSGEYYFVEHCEDGTERLVFATPELDARALERLARADSQRRGATDPYAEAEQEQDDFHAAIDAKNREVLYETGERVAHALRQDGAPTPMPLKVAVPRDL